MGDRLTASSVCPVPGCPMLIRPGGDCPTHPRPPKPPSPSTRLRHERGWTRARRRVFRAAGGQCARCDQPAAVVDHITPAALGGTNDPDNLQALCANCHRAKTKLDLRAVRDGRRTTKKEGSR